MNRIPKLLLASTLLLPVAVLAAQPATNEPDAARAEAQAQARYESMLQEAERARMQAEAARKEAMKAAEMAREAGLAQAKQAEIKLREGQNQAELAREQELHRQEATRIREELSKAHRELREAQRDVARAHRELGRVGQVQREIRVVNLGDRAVIGVVLGAETEKGVKLVGISPDGPADRAGLKSGDTLVSLAGHDLSGEKRQGREIVYRVMDDVKAGEKLEMTVLRDGETKEFTVTAEQREPLTWQSMISIPPQAPPVPGAPAATSEAPKIVVEHIEVPDIDREALQQRMDRLSEDLKSRRFTVVVSDDEELDEIEDVEFPESFDFEFEGYSDLAEQAMSEANLWFGLRLSQGLELATVNEDLGSYFNTDRGVLVVRAEKDNAYQLQSGDVVLDINGREVNSPPDMMRALREMDPGSEVAIGLKRNRKERTINVVIPENRVGYSWSSKTEQDAR